MMVNFESLKLFISYTGKGIDVWRPLERYLTKMYGCKILWGKDEFGKYKNVNGMMEAMVKESHIAIFLLTHESWGIREELKLWYQYNGNKFENALLFIDKNIEYKKVWEYVGTELPFGHLDSENPWENVDSIIPNIHRLILTSIRLAEPWMESYSQIVKEFAFIVIERNIRLDNVLNFFNKICSKREYRDPKMWLFRLNWPRGPSGIDSYSDEINCLTLLSALLHPDSPATSYEIEEIFKSLQDVFIKNDRPPRKLSGRIVFADSATRTLHHVQSIIGSHPYEKLTKVVRPRPLLPNIIPDDPSGLFLPKDVIYYNYETFRNMQTKILQVAGQVCKYVLCSTFQISISYATFMYAEGDKDHGFLVMACTAAGADKEQLSAIADIPILVSESNTRVVWYGQMYKKPTSEHRSHWAYHDRAAKKNIDKNLIIHFHPVDLLELYELISCDKLSENEIYKEVEMTFTGKRIDFQIDKNYQKHSAREESFGEFMFEMARKKSSQKKRLNVIWKPNHGIWLLTNSSQEIVQDLLEIQDASCRAKRASLENNLKHSY
jgi:hypothetical protein